MVSSSVWDVFFAALGAGVGALLLVVIDYLGTWVNLSECRS